MSIGILVIAEPFNHGGAILDPPEWLRHADVDAYDGRGDADTTPDPTLALRFPDAREAMAFWNQQSTVRPLREDGQPNKPLTSLTVSIEEIPE